VRHGHRGTVAVIGALACSVALLYAQTLRHDFVILDDPTYVSENPVVARGLTSDGVRWAFTTFHASNWHPLTWLSHMLDSTLFGSGPAGPHFTNAALHAANSAILFLALRSMTGALWPSALVSALFAVHPLRVESVAWASERKDVLSGLFWMLTLLAYVWYARRPRFARYGAVTLCFTLGLLAKPMLVTLPFVLLLLDVWPLKRGSWFVVSGLWLPNETRSADEKNRKAESKSQKRETRNQKPKKRDKTLPSLAMLLLEKVPLLALAAVASVMTVRAQRFGLALQDTAELPLPWRIANALTAYVAYARKTLWPSDLAVFYPHPGLIHPALSATDWAWAIGAAALLLLATLAAVLMAPRRPYVIVGWLWYLGTLVPVIGLVQVGEQALADRYAYVPTVGLYLAAAWGLSDLVSRRPRARRPVISAAAAALLALGTAAWFQIGTWRDSLTLFTHATNVTRDSYFAYSNLGNLYRNQNRLAEAAAALERALRIKPNFAFAQTNYGVVLERQGRLEDAAAHHLRAIEINPASAKAHANLGLVRTKQGRLAEAVTHLERAVRLDPGSVYARANLAAALLKDGQIAAALPHLTFALERDPGNAESHNNLGVALARLGRLAEALEHFETALRINPDYASARNSRDYVRARLGSAAP
jgi:tetratricopeptide (TPR) repeat protein